MLEIINDTIKQKYTVLYHGTSKERLEKIKKLGYLTEKNVLNGEYKTTKQTVCIKVNENIYEDVNMISHFLSDIVAWKR